MIFQNTGVRHIRGTLYREVIMGKAMVYAAGAIMLIGVVIQNFVHEFPVPAYIAFLAVCVLTAACGNIIDRRQGKKG